MTLDTNSFFKKIRSGVLHPDESAKSSNAKMAAVNLSAQHLPTPSAAEQLRALAAYAEAHNYSFDTYGAFQPPRLPVLKNLPPSIRLGPTRHPS